MENQGLNKKTYSQISALELISEIARNYVKQYIIICMKSKMVLLDRKLLLRNCKSFEKPFRFLELNIPSSKGKAINFYSNGFLSKV